MPINLTNPAFAIPAAAMLLALLYVFLFGDLIQMSPDGKQGINAKMHARDQEASGEPGPRSDGLNELASRNMVCWMCG